MVQNDNVYFRIIIAISLVIPLAVFVLLQLPQGILGDWNASIIPKINAVINSLTAILLCVGFYFIRQKNILAHQRSMLLAFALSALFLVLYIVYHAQVIETKYPGIGTIRYVYFFFLISHILLSGILVPLVLLTIYRSTTGQIEKHRKIARYTLPIWLYVAITGVIVYFMISPYYPV